MRGRLFKALIPILEETSAVGRMFDWRTLLILTLSSFFMAVPNSHAREIAPIVQTNWLEANLSKPGVIIIDIRPSAEYLKGHIPGALNIPMREWTVTRAQFLLELPSEDELRHLLERSGITPSSKVVVVTEVETDFGRANAYRVAWTCMVAGLKNVAVLDGGFTKWARENRPLTQEVPASPSFTAYPTHMDYSSLVSKSYLASHLSELIIVDTRTPEDYFGITSKQGHIRGAVNLPAPWAFNADGTLRTMEELRSMAEGVIGNDRSKGIVVYCQVGGYSAVWWFLLSEVLGYRNVKQYDGSLEEWVRDPLAPVLKHTWH